MQANVRRMRRSIAGPVRGRFPQGRGRFLHWVVAGAIVALGGGGADDPRSAEAAQGHVAIDADVLEQVWRDAGLCGIASPVRARATAFRPYPVVTASAEDAVVDPVEAPTAAGAIGGCAASDAMRSAPCDGAAGRACDAPADACPLVGCDPEPGCAADGAAIGSGLGGRRFYVAGIIGASFGTLQSGGVNTAGGFPNSGSASDSLLTAGAAVGTAWERADGRVRLEIEGRGRDALVGTTDGFSPSPTPYAVRAVDGWSVLTNVWRDWYLGDRLGVYGGGGIGGGGYRLTVDDGISSGYGHVGGFAWQVGMGVTYDLTRRTTLDLGYRFFDTQSTPLALVAAGGGPAGTYRSNFYASELLFTVRIYDPFRQRPTRWIPGD